MQAGIVLVILVIAVILYFKFKNSIFKAKDAEMSKEAQKLDTEATEIDTKIITLKAELAKAPQEMNINQVEDFWNKK